MEKIRVGIIGGAGYTGGELLRILVHHRKVAVRLVTSESLSGQKVTDVYPQLKGRCDLTFISYDPEVVKKECQFVFLAKPQPDSFQPVQELFGEVRLIDLSADFRFSNSSDFQFWYQREHQLPELLKESVYGLPELFAEKIRTAKLVANPGCYPTGIILAVYPLMKEGLIEPTVRVSAVSGFSGAGRTPSLNNMAYAVVDNIRPYKVGIHPHTGEIIEVLAATTGKKVVVHFVPQVAGFERGILSVIFLRLKSPQDWRQIAASYQKDYPNAPFVHLYAEGRFPEIKDVVYTNICALGWQVVAENSLIVISALDNLVKGAAGQAVQNLNLMAGFSEEEGLV